MRRILLFLFFPLSFSHAQLAGDIDPKFNPQDVGFGLGEGFNGLVNCVVEQPDGKWLVGGKFTAYNGVKRFGLCRLNADGSLDATFNNGIGLDQPNVRTIRLLPDGKILVGGDFTKYNNISKLSLCKLVPTGAIDPAFLYPSLTNKIYGEINSIGIQSDGKIVLGGFFRYPTMFDVGKGIHRLNADGTVATNQISTGFRGDNPSTQSGFIQKIQIDTQDGILCMGMFTYYNGRLQHDFARLRPDCSLDTTYLLRFSVAPTQFAQVEGGKIIVTGVFSDVNQTQARPNVVRINPDGSIDYSFNGGYGFTDTLLANYKPPSAILPGYQNRYLFTGTFTRYNSRPVKGFAFTDRNGIRDSTATFLPGINLLTSDLLFTPVLNKKTVVTGTVESEARERSFVFLVLDSNLNILQNLVQNTGQGAINGEVNKVLPAWNNSSYIIGSYSLYNQNPNHGFIKIDGTGKIDTTFKPSDNWKAANPLKVLRNKRLLVARTLLSGDTRLGVLDSTGKHVGFDSAGTFVQGWIKTVYEQKDGRILIGGYFFAVGGIVKNYAARLLPDGQLDLSFSPPVTVNNIVTAFHQDEKDRILVFGTFSTAGALRLDSSGGIDTGFIIPNTPEIKKVLVSRDKSIYIQTTLTAAAIIKYDSTGIRDITFQAALQPPNGDPNMGVVQDAFMQEDGKLVLAGNFTKYNNQDSKGLVRIFPNGQIDTSFKVGLGIAGNVLNPVIYSLAPFPNGRFLTVGDFTSYQGTGRNRIAKIYYQKADVLIDSIPLRLCINGEHTVSFHCQAFEPEDSLRLQLSNSLGLFTNTIVLKTIKAIDRGTIPFAFPTGTAAGNNYRFRIVAAGPTPKTGTSSDTVILVPNPSVEISVSADSILLHNGPFASVQWFLSGNSLTGQTDTLLVGAASGSYCAVVANTLGCVDTSATILFTSIKARRAVGNWQLFPNPAEDDVTISGTSELSSVRIVDVLGKEVIPKASDFKSNLKLGQLPPGIYYLTIQGNDQSMAVLKLVKR